MRTLGIGVAMLAVMAFAASSRGQGGGPVLQAVYGETHPYQHRLICERAPGSTLVGNMYDISSGARVKVTDFSWGGNVGACELAVRASRNGRVCVTKGYGAYAVRDLATNVDVGRYTTLASCTSVTRGAPALRTQPGFVDFIPPAELAPFVADMPTLSDPVIDQAIRGAGTMWYDEAALTFVYQDSFGDPKGLRANRVGYDVGINASEPDIRALVEYFDPGKFKFPFAVVAGANFTENVYALYFWRPPTINGVTKPVRVWQNDSHWQWVFPVGTVLGEALFIQAPDDKQWFAFEVRSRVRAIDRWETAVFRPYLQATDLAAAIKARRPGWASAPDLLALVDHLESSSNLVPYTMTAPAYAAIFPSIQGAMDYLPATTDVALIKELLRDTTFQKANGTHWKTDGTRTTFAPSTRATFHVVPRDYNGGMFETTEASCRRCHDQTSRPLNNLDPRVVLYGEMWGEDEIFTWHPFAIDEDTFGVSDGNRHMNTRLVTAGLVEQRTPQSDPQNYRALPKPYVADYE